MLSLIRARGHTAACNALSLTACPAPSHSRRAASQPPGGFSFSESSPPGASHARSPSQSASTLRISHNHHPPQRRGSAGLGRVRSSTLHAVPDWDDIRKGSGGATACARRGLRTVRAVRRRRRTGNGPGSLRRGVDRTNRLGQCQGQPVNSAPKTLIFDVVTSILFGRRCTG